MDPIVIGAGALVVVTGAISIALVLTLRRAREDGVAGVALWRRILPLLVADALFILVWVIWLVTNL
jgi:hypothetical protein